MFISINHIPVTPGREADFEQLFRQRERSVQEQPGFISLDVLKPGAKMQMGKPIPDDSNEYQVLTRWQSAEAFRNWISSDSFKKSHSRESDPAIFAGKSYLSTHETVEGAGSSLEIASSRT